MVSRAASLPSFLTPGANAVAVADATRKVMDQLQQRFPPDLAYAVGLDTTLPVTEGIHEILVTLVIAMALVILVVYVFLQNWRATLIPMIAVPVSLIGTFAFFPALGFSINTLSLFGLVLAIGLVVDDAIVVVEAVEHHIEEGMSPRDATLQAMREVSGPVVAIALILASVFVPMAFMSGIQGQLEQAVRRHRCDFRAHFGLQRLNALACALRHAASPAEALARPAGPLLQRLQLGLSKSTKQLCEREPGTYSQGRGGACSILACFVLLDASIGRKLPTSFLPDEDYGFLFLNAQLPPAASLARTDVVARKIRGHPCQHAGRAALHHD